MKSVRIGASLEARLLEAARMTGDPISRIIREAIEERCDLLLGDSGGIVWNTARDSAGSAEADRTGRAGALRQ